MIKLIATIDSARGLCNFQIPKAKTYEAKKLSTGYLQPLRQPFDDRSRIDPYFSANPNVWVVGSPELYEQALPYADQLYITQVNGIFEAKDYFPRFEDRFVLIKRSRIFSENGFEYQFQVWVNKLLAHADDARDINTGEL